MFFTNLLIKFFIKTPNDLSNPKIRDNYGFLGGIIGVLINFILFLIKFIIGTIVSSIAITADAFNNLSDSLSSFITILGFKIANKPADKKHPFGYGRIEYISAFIVSFLVMLVGIEFSKSSISKIIKPESITFQIVPFILLLISIIFKLWLSFFTKNIGTKINSAALKASSTDALGDVFTSSCVALSFLLSKYISFPIDGYLGLLVALFIIYSGFSLVKDTLNPLLGETPNLELVNSITSMVLSYENIYGVHDLIIHNYGPNKFMATIHAEVPSDISFIKIHEIIDQAEREISEKLNLFLVIHMDPLCVLEEDNIKTRDEVLDIIQKNEYIHSMHDFRIVGENDIKNLIFDVVVNTNTPSKITDSEIQEMLISKITKIHPLYQCIITVDRNYIGDI